MMRNQMINKVTDHRGRPRTEVSKYSPDGARFRRFAPALTHLSPIYSARVVIEAQRKEALGLQEENRRKEGPPTEATPVSDSNLLISECRKGDSNPHALASAST